MKPNKNEAYVFEPNLYPLENGIRLIEASAGTGKTFSLAHLVLRLITEKKYLINQILVVSFTEATSSEIKAKIIERLILALKIIESDSEEGLDDDIDEVLKEWSSLNLKTKDNRILISSLILEALERIDTAEITTIHGFCSKTIRREAIDNGSKLNPKIEKDSYSLIQEIVEEYWKKEILEIESNDLKGILKSNFSIKNLSKALNFIENDSSNNYLNTYNNIFSNESLSNQFYQHIESLWSEFIKLWEIEGKELEESFKEFALELKSIGISDTKPYSAKPRKNRYMILNSWIDEYKNTKRPSYNDIQTQILFTKYFHPNNLINLITKYEIINELPKNSKLLFKIGELIDSPKDFVWEHAITWINKEIEKRKNKEGIIIYSDLLKSLDPKRLLIETNEKKVNKGKVIFNNLRHRYKVALIDEFQDTDPVQLRLLHEVFGKKKHHLLLMIGDPKQAIYSFRGGDLNTYMKARGKADRIDYMNKNYRATKSLILILNKFFGDGLIRSGLKTQKLLPCSKEKKITLKGIESPLQVLNLIDNYEEQSSTPESIDSKSKVEEKIPQVISSYLLKLLNNNPRDLIPSDICILVNRHDQAKSISSYLSKVKIPSKLINNSNIFAGEGAQLLQILINSIATPNDQQKVSLLACSELLQWDKNQLISAKTNGNFDSLSLKLNDLSKSLPWIGITGCLAELLQGELMADISQRGSLLSDLYQTAQLVDEQIYLQKLNAIRSSQWLNRQRMKPCEPIPEEYQPNSDVADSSVNIITIHKSKGLQFKVVICPYLWQKPPDNKGLLWKMNESLFISRKYKWNKDFNNYEKLVKQQSLQEAERLAYVAMTRAKNQLIIIWAKAKDQEGNPLSGFLFGPEAINHEITDHSRELMEQWKKTRQLNIDIKDIKCNKPKGSWRQTKNNLKLSLGLIPKHKLDNNWGRYSYSSWATKQSQKSIKPYFPEESNEDFSFKDQIEGILSPNQTMQKNDSIKSQPNQNLWPNKNPISDFPRGAIAGSCLHKILEQIEFDKIENQELISKLIQEQLRISNINDSFNDSIYNLLTRIANLPLGSSLGKSNLKNLSKNHMIKELNFDIPICHNKKPINTTDISSIFKQNINNRFGIEYSRKLKELNISSTGFLTGSIDLIFSDNTNNNNAKWWVLDWKSNWIGNNFSKEDISDCGLSNYNELSMDKEMYTHHYPLQAHIYLLALHRFLNWRLPDYSPQKHLGGYIYVFLRGIPDKIDIIKRNYPDQVPGLIIEKAPLERIKRLDSLIR